MSGGTGKWYADVCLCGSAHTSGCVIDGLGAWLIALGLWWRIVIIEMKGAEKRQEKARKGS